MLLVHILALSLLCKALLCTEPVVTLGLMLFTLTIWSFYFRFMKKPTPAWPLFALEWHSTWPLCKIMKHSSGLLTSEIPITSNMNLVSLSSSSEFLYVFIS